MTEQDVPRWVQRMRDAGYVVTPATRDTLPDPEHTLPARVGYVRHLFRRFGAPIRAHRSPRAKHAHLP
jgi:hypothetical protein